MTDEEKIEFAKKVSPELLWQMAEGRPSQDLTSGGEKFQPIPIYGGISKHDGDSEDIQPEKED